EVMKKESAARSKVTADQRKLLAARYDLTPKRDSKVTMSRGKPLCVGPTARLPEGVTWDKLAAADPAEIRKRNLFPYPSLPHPLPQEEFNHTDDRKSPKPQLGVACLDCHINGHTTGQFHLSPDIRPQERRFRLDTVSLRGVFNQQIHGSKRSLRSVEDFTEFVQRTAYFNGDPIRPMKKGL